MSLAEAVLDRAGELRRSGERFVVATVVRVEPPTSARAGDKALITADGKLWGWIGGSCSEALVKREALIALGDGQPRLVKIAPEMSPEHLPGVVEHMSTCPSAGSLDVFIDPQVPQPRLLVVGATPAAHMLIRLGATMGFHTIAVQPGATQSEFPDASELISALDPSSVAPDANTWCVVATMGHYDEDAIQALLAFDTAYLGLIASQRRAATVLSVLRDRGVKGLERVVRAGQHSIGGSQEEIALAALADIVAERRARHQAVAIVLPEIAVDPICGMSVEVSGAMHTVVEGEKTYYFCSAGCLDAFKARVLETPSPALPTRGRE